MSNGEEIRDQVEPQIEDHVVEVAEITDGRRGEWQCGECNPPLDFTWKPAWARHMDGHGIDWRTNEQHPRASYPDLAQGTTVTFPPAIDAGIFPPYAPLPTTEPDGEPPVRIAVLHDVLTIHRPISFQMLRHLIQSLDLDEDMTSITGDGDSTVVRALIPWEDDAA